MRRIWNFFTAPGLTVTLAALICMDSVWGSLLAMKRPDFFRPLDQALLMPWLLTTGKDDPGLSLWIYILVGLTALFALNTVVCTADKLYSIVKQKKRWQAFFPQIVHVGFLVALLGHLVGSMYGFRSPGNIVFEGEPFPVPENPGLSVRLDDVDVKVDTRGRMDSMKTTVTLLREGEEFRTGTIELNGPFIYEGIAFYYLDHGRMPTGLRLGVDGEVVEAEFGGSFKTGDGERFVFGTLYPDLGFTEDGRPYSRSTEYRNPFQVIVSPEGERAFMPVSKPGGEVSLGNRTIRLLDYVMGTYAVLTINRDPGIWFIIVGSLILVVGMLLLLFLRGERGELVRKKESVQSVVDNRGNSQ
ncbi:MAG: cytochrome c biogenesis protein ResB [Thermodesulfobacteriota bacterium]